MYGTTHCTCLTPCFLGLYLLNLGFLHPDMNFFHLAPLPNSYSPLLPEAQMPPSFWRAPWCFQTNCSFCPFSAYFLLSPAVTAEVLCCRWPCISFHSVCDGDLLGVSSLGLLALKETGRVGVFAEWSDQEQSPLCVGGTWTSLRHENKPLN